jgi:hypothetical protein
MKHSTVLQAGRRLSQSVNNLPRAWMSLAIVIGIATALALWGGQHRFFAWPCPEANEQSNDNVLTAETVLALLSRPDGERQLTSYSEITVDAARMLAQHNGIVDLIGLRSLSPAIAKQLSALPEMSSLKLEGLETLPTESAKAIVRCRCKSLWLGGLKELTPDLAALLAEYGAHCSQGSYLKLTGVSQMSPDVMKAISRSHALVLNLNGLQQLDLDGATLLAEFQGQVLLLDGLRVVPPDISEALSHFRGRWMSLSHVRELSPAAARSLAKFTGEKLFLDGLQHPSEDVLALLRGFKGELVLANATNESPAETGGVIMGAHPDSSW